MFRAVKLWCSSSISGPSSTKKPAFRKIFSISDNVVVIGWIEPVRDFLPGNVISIDCVAIFVVINDLIFPYN